MQKTTKEQIQYVTSKIVAEERAIEFQTNWLEQELTSKKEEIVAAAGRIQDQMQRLIAGFETDGIEVNFNTLGEIQGKGSELDRLLGELATMRKMYQNLGSM